MFGAREAAWPLIRDDVGLSYAEIGLLLSIPNAVSLVVEPVLGVASVTWRRRALVLGGGVAVDGGTVANATAIDITADGGTAIADASGGDFNFAFVS